MYSGGAAGRRRAAAAWQAAGLLLVLPWHCWHRLAASVAVSTGTLQGCMPGRAGSRLSCSPPQHPQSLSARLGTRPGSAQWNCCCAFSDGVRSACTWWSHHSTCEGVGRLCFALLCFPAGLLRCCSFCCATGREMARPASMTTVMEPPCIHSYGLSMGYAYVDDDDDDDDDGDGDNDAPPTCPRCMHEQQQSFAFMRGVGWAASVLHASAVSSHMCLPWPFQCCSSSQPVPQFPCIMMVEYVWDAAYMLSARVRCGPPDVHVLLWPGTGWCS
ncbi:hypothetical protein COO60DRAFT_635404 [Scenedesmus sp. NREL 46B-D3]|nr:hypothetical protein COO60DRAFT_635404 [Scenedesmus sp. NREL 46B-D3]